MPTGPNGEKRPADVVGCAVTVMRIAQARLKTLATNSQGSARVARLEERRVQKR